MGNETPASITEESHSDSEKEVRLIEALIEELAGYERDNPENKDVTRALEITRTQIQLHKQGFVDNETLVTYHGSLQYKDPKKLDLDLIFTAESQASIVSSTEKIVDLQLLFEVLPGWPEVGNNKGRCVSDFGWQSLEKIEEQVKSYEADPDKFYEDEDLTATHLSILLTARTLYPEQESLHQRLKDRTWQVVRSSPVLRKNVTDTLNDVLEIRKSRKQP